MRLNILLCLACHRDILGDDRRRSGSERQALVRNSGHFSAESRSNAGVLPSWRGHRLRKTIDAGHYQSLGVELKYRANRNAVSGVTPRFSRTISLTRGAVARNATASACADKHKGAVNSSRKISPGWMARILFILPASMVVKI